MPQNKQQITGIILAGMLMLLSADSAWAQPSSESVSCLVTAYYSPLPDQDYYITGTYEGDIALNGAGSHGASGKPVFEGMLAAPERYPFGTQVNIPGLGVGDVQDRGGAIVEHDNYVRFDVWMGEGEAGLSKALNWGSRMMTCEVYLGVDAVSTNLDASWVSSELHQSYEAQFRVKTAQSQIPILSDSASEEDSLEVSEAVETAVLNQEPSFESNVVEPVPVSLPEPVEDNVEVKSLSYSQSALAPDLAPGHQGEAVRKLQRLLWELDYFHQELTGYYDDATSQAVLAFQLEQGILASAQDSGAGFFGPQTYEALMQVIDQKIEVLESYPQDIQTWVPAQKELPSVTELSAPENLSIKADLVFLEVKSNKNFIQDIHLEQPLRLEDQGPAVLALQNVLIDHGYLAAGLNTGYYGKMTAQAVFDFQLEQEIIKRPLDPGAGELGPQTLEALNHLF